MNFCKIWIEQCEAARGIEDEFGTQNALDYLVGEKFLNFLGAAEHDKEFRAEIPAFVAEIKKIFEHWQLAEYLEKSRQTEPFDPGLYADEDDAEVVEMERTDDIRRSASDLLLVERAKEWLQDEGGVTAAAISLGAIASVDPLLPRTQQQRPSPSSAWTSATATTGYEFSGALVASTLWISSFSEMSTLLSGPRLLAGTPCSQISTTTKKIVLLLSDRQGNIEVVAGTRKFRSSLHIL